MPDAALAAGALLGFLPALRAVQFPPEVVLLLFLPVLLYWESLNTSLRDIRRSLRGVVLVSTLLVIATAGAVASVAHAFGMPWGPAWVLGAAVAPTDATALAAVERLLPHRNLTVLKAESLINDGTALVIYGVAVGVTVGEIHLSAATVTGRVLIAYLGGVAAGALIAWLSLILLRRLTDPLLVNVLTLLVPFTAYLVAESVEASGVLAVVVSGLAVSRAAPRLMAAATRNKGHGLWTVAAYLLNGTLFVLVGLEVQSAVRGLTSTDVIKGLIMVVAVAVTLVVVRTAFLFLSAYTIRALDRRPEQRLRRVSDRSRMVSGLAGFRGAVSLAVALSVPTILDSGDPSRTGTRLSSSPQASSCSPSSSRVSCCPTWSAGHTSRPTPPSRANAAAPRPPRSGRRWTPSTPSPPASAPTPKLLTGCARSTSSTYASSLQPPTRMPTAQPRCTGSSTPPSSALRSWPANAPPSSASATRTPSPTRCSAKSRPSSTTRRTGSPRQTASNRVQEATCSGARGGSAPLAECRPS